MAQPTISAAAPRLVGLGCVPSHTDWSSTPHGHIRRSQHGARCVPTDSDHVDEWTPQERSQPVARRSADPVPVPDAVLADGPPCRLGERRDERIQRAYRKQRLHHFSAHDFQSTPRIPDAVAEHTRSDCVRDSRHHPPNSRVFSPGSVPAHEIELLSLERIDHVRDVPGWVLPVSIQNDDNASSRFVEAGVERSPLSPILFEPHTPERRCDAGDQFVDYCRGSIPAAVVDEDALEGPSQPLHRLTYLLRKAYKRRGLVEHRHDDRESRRTLDIALSHATPKARYADRHRREPTMAVEIEARPPPSWRP